MAARIQIEFKVKWFPIVAALINPTKYSTILLSEQRRAGKIVGAKLAGIMRRKIRGGIDPANAALTRDMKGSSKSLVVTGRLFKSVTWRARTDAGDQEITVGVMRTAPTANIAKLVHDGGTQMVTRKMEVMFKMLWLASTGKKVTLKSPRAQQLLAQSQGVIPFLKEGQTLVIPPRPFALLTLRDDRTNRILESQYREALRRTWERMQK